ncbi:MAG: protein kinase domain-containing protein [Limisphaerales bacterium]
MQALLDALEEADGFMETREHTPGTTRNPVATPIIGIEERPGFVIGNYKLLQEIGAGGFGVVYMAEQQRPVKRKVALKIIKPGMDTREVVARFEAERQALALMSHPNIAQVFDGGATESGRPYFVMELVKGIPITEFCDKSKLNTNRRLNLFLDICSAIQHAHQKGVIHRDIKPSNVLITLHDGVPVPKVIDFGIAKALNQELTEKSLFTAYGQMIGTPMYSSPEQAEMSGLDIDTRSDIYSLGVLLYELLTGETPINRNEVKKAGLQELQKLIKEKEATKPSLALSILCRESTTVAEFRREDSGRLIDEIKGDLDWIVLKALEKDRTRRYETASGFAEDIRRYLDNRPVAASPPTVSYLLGKFMRRNVRLIASITGVFLALMIGAVGMTVLYFGARADRQTAQEQTRAATQSRIQAEDARAAESKQRELTQQSARQLQTTLSRADFSTGVAHLERDDPEKGLSYLARSLRTDPGFTPAAQRIVATLRDQNFELQPEIKLQHEEAIRDFTLSQDGRHVLTTALDQTVRLWDAKTMQLKKEWGTEDPVVASEFLGPGSHVLVAGVSGTIRLWELSNLRTSGPPILTGSRIKHIHAVLRSSGKPTVAAVTGDGGIRVWDGQSGQALTPALKVADLQATACFLNPDGTRVLGRFGSQLFRYYEAEGGMPVSPEIATQPASRQMPILEHDTLLIIGRGRNNILPMNLASGTKHPAKIAGSRKLRMVARAQLSPDQSRLITVCRPTTKVAGRSGRVTIAGSDVITRVFDAMESVQIAEATDTNSFHRPVIHAESGISALQVDNFRIRIRDLKTMRILAEIRLGEAIASAAPERPNILFSPSGDRLAIRCAESGFAVYRTLSGKLQTKGGAGRVPFRRIQFSPEGQRLATITGDGNLRIWNANSGTPITAPFQHRISIGKVVFSRDGRRVFSLDRNEAGAGTQYGVVRCWEANGTAASYPARPCRPPPWCTKRGCAFPTATTNGKTEDTSSPPPPRPCAGSWWTTPGARRP